MDNQAYDNEQMNQYREEELRTYSPMRMALRGTVLGHFLETRERRYLLSFLCYAAAFALFFGVIAYAVMAFKSGSIMGDDNHAFFGKLFTIGCWIGGCISAASLFAQRYSMALQAGLATAFLIFLTIMRP